MNDEAAAESPPRFEFDVPELESRLAEPAQPAHAAGPTTPRVASKSLWVVAAVAIAAVGAVAVLLVMYSTTVSDRDDAEQALSDSEVNLAETKADFAKSEANLTDTEAILADSETKLRESEASLADKEADLADSEAKLTDSETLVTEYHDTTADFLALSITTVIDITDDDATCMANTLLESLGPEALGRLTDTQSTDAFGLEAMRVASDCGVSLDTFVPQPGITYGDNPTMDALYDECAAGSGASCDALYQQSGVRTEYESFGLTCGNRFGARDAPPVCEGNI